MNTQGAAEYELDGKNTGDEKGYRESMSARQSAAKQSLLSKAENNQLSVRETEVSTKEGGSKLYAHLTETQAIVVLVMNTIMCPMGFFIGAFNDKRGINCKYLLFSAVGAALGFLRMMQVFHFFGCFIAADINQ